MPKKPKGRRKKRTGATQALRRKFDKRKEARALQPSDTPTEIDIALSNRIDLSEMPPGLRQKRLVESIELAQKIEGISSIFDQYEELARDVFKEEGENGIIPLLDLLNGAGVFDDTFQELYTDAARQNIADFEADIRDMKELYGAHGVYHAEQEHKRMWIDRIKKISTRKPLMHFVMEEMGLARHLVGMRADYDSHQTPQRINSALSPDLRDQEPHKNFVAALRVDKAFGKILRMHRSTQDVYEKYSDEIVEVVRDVEFAETEWKDAKRTAWLGPRPQEGQKRKMLGVVRVYVEKDNHPFTICSFDVHTPRGRRLFNGNISRITGKPVLPQTALASMQLAFPTPGVYESLRATIMRAVNNSIEQNAFVEVLDTNLEDTKHSEVETTETEVESESVVLPQDYSEPEKQTVSVQVLSVAEPTSIERVPLPSMTFFQFSKTLRNCRVKIMGGGKHLKAVYGNLSTTFYNNHSGERRFQSSEIQRVVDKLGIHDMFVERMPRRLQSTYKQRVSQRHKQKE